MDDGGRCLLDVINDPKLLQSFLESGSDENSKDFPDGTSSESAIESPQVPRNSQAAHASNISSADNLIDQTEMGGTSFILTPTSVGSQTYQHASSSGATIHHHPSTTNNVNFHPHSPASARSVTPSHNIKSPNVGPSSVNSMPPPSPLQQTKSPMPSHTPSPVPSWSPVAPVSPAASRNQPSMPSVAFQQTQNQILQTSCNPTQYVTAFTTPQSVAQKLTVQQQQQQIYLQQQIPPASQQQTTPRLTTVPTPCSYNCSCWGSTTSKTTPQILPKPATSSASNQYVSPASTPKQTQTIPATTGQRTLGIQSGAAPLVINQAQPGMPSSNPSGQTLNSSTTQNNALIAALQNPNQQAIFASAKQSIHGQQTIMIPNNIAHTGLAPQNINLTSAAIPNSGIISSSSQGQNF
ncbi:GLTSCR1 domain-containing protein [Caerostris extrusa]|uniref:GLTSCR1 domain-containing protein n=1 Tax=Caerostris extrusa TaxID=172846 RepID=A0AAV4TL13_CAEEX|nr:GLTSCR1 domain-containing protein [Caerostris extrusa]